MRIGVAGKGGAGKTTVSATMARLFARRGYDVNALDGDPNPNFAAALGLPPGEIARLTRVPREGVLEERIGPDQEASLHLTRPFEDVVKEYGAVGPDGVRMLTMTGLLGAGRGCICGQHSAVRGFVDDLGATRPEDITILDTEASIEHLSRGTVGTVDALLVVVEPYFRALETLGRTVPLARELGIPDTYVVANKVRSDWDESTIREYSQRLEVEVLGMIPFDEAVAQADRENRSLIDTQPSSPALTAIDAMVQSLIDRQTGKLATGAGAPSQAAV
ncbi:MAG: carbon monoxide dehydrogenase [Chloroflexota bacterium]|nr:carbon monoxide dehydrogenase [Chloroflexota bacterium]